MPKGDCIPQPWNPTDRLWLPRAAQPLLLSTPLVSPSHTWRSFSFASLLHLPRVSLLLATLRGSELISRSSFACEVERDVRIRGTHFPRERVVNTRKLWLFFVAFSVGLFLVFYRTRCIGASAARLSRALRRGSECSRKKVREGATRWNLKRFLILASFWVTGIRIEWASFLLFLPRNVSESLIEGWFFQCDFLVSHFLIARNFPEIWSSWILEGLIDHTANLSCVILDEFFFIYLLPL